MMNLSIKGILLNVNLSLIRYNILQQKKRIKKMKLNIVELGTRTKKDGNKQYFIKALATVQSYGQPSTELITIKVDSLAPYKVGEYNLDILLPHQDYPYALR